MADQTDDEAAAEQRHFEDTCEAFRDYMTYHVSNGAAPRTLLVPPPRDSLQRQLGVNHVRRMGFLTLPKEHRHMLERVGYKVKLAAVDAAIRRWAREVLAE